MNSGSIIMKKKFLECGKICSAHGVRGALKIDPWCDTPKVLAMQKQVYFEDKGGEYRAVSVISASVSNRFVLMSLEGINTREDAQALKNVVIYLRREDIPLPPGAVLIADIIGLPMIDVDTGATYGEVSDVTDGVQGKLYTVRTEKGDVIIPGAGDFIKEIDAERGVFIRPIPGFFD